MIGTIKETIMDSWWSLSTLLQGSSSLSAIATCIGTQEMITLSMPRHCTFCKSLQLLLLTCQPSFVETTTQCLTLQLCSCSTMKAFSNKILISVISSPKKRWFNIKRRKPSFRSRNLCNFRVATTITIQERPENNVILPGLTILKTSRVV